jgi:hypothetical protein
MYPRAACNRNYWSYIWSLLCMRGWNESASGDFVSSQGKNLSVNFSKTTQCHILEDIRGTRQKMWSTNLELFELMALALMWIGCWPIEKGRVSIIVWAFWGGLQEGKIIFNLCDFTLSNFFFFVTHLLHNLNNACALLSNCHANLM